MVKKNSQTKKSKKKEKEGKITRTLFDTFSHTTDTHTHKEDRTIKKRLKDFVSVKRRRSLRRSAFIYILFSKRDYYTLCHQKHIKIIISTFLKIQGRER